MRKYKLHWWKSTINHVLEVYADRMPGALIEEKDFSLAFHYRLCEPDLVATKYPLTSAAFFFHKNKLWDICDKGHSHDVVTGTL